jgi:predicted DNA-binding ribbon-helix-helix protein
VRRTTLILEDACMDALKDLAHREGRPLTRVVNEILVEGVRRRARRPAIRVRIPTFRMGRPQVDLADREALEAAMES